jgi:predicted DNA-binding protein
MKWCRKQIYLHPECETNLKKVALLTKRSESSLIREALEEFLKNFEKSYKKNNNPLLKLIGICKTGRTDSSINHDKYLYKKDKS